ncbi:hypothetical protein CCPUN_07370 [Cardinium endosymbiont of Culicoides punctatus]|nr:hypothetical protein CCPUN_07370 [Cardinium endosymbiont of Culicoides punctatus]
MRYTKKTINFFVFIITIFLGSKKTWANIESEAPTKDATNETLTQDKKELPSLVKEKTNDPLALEEENAAKAKELPLVKIAHKDILDLLYSLFVPKAHDIPIYMPMLQHAAIKINWFGLTRRFWTKEQRTYEGGIDLYFRHNVQLAIDLGYEYYKPKHILHNNKLLYQSTGKYVSGSLRYAILTQNFAHAYVGIGYTQSRFDITTFHNNVISDAVKTFTHHWFKLILGSEARLIPNSGLYGGTQFGVMRLIGDVKSTNPKLQSYSIPGYGNVMNKINFELIMYLKWSVSFLEKKITI